MRDDINYCIELLEYCHKYGNFGFCNLDDKISYHNKKTDTFFYIPDELSNKTLEELCKKSLLDEKDYVYEYATNNKWEIIDYETNEDEEI